jgi:hypothetical protein
MKIIKPLHFYFFLCSGLFLLTPEGYAQHLLTTYKATEKVELVLPLTYFGQSDVLTITDSIIITQFIEENDLPASFQEQDINKRSFRFYEPSPYFSSTAGMDGKLQIQIAIADSFRLRNQGASIRKKVARAELFIGGTELLCMGILMAMPREVTNWQPGYLKDAMKNIKSAFTTMPVNDEDAWGFNFVGHPIAGSLYYNAIRSQDATIFQSFVFSFAQSAIWEYIIEGSAEQPSLQDMIITPIFGTLLGEASHVATIKMRRNGFNWLEKITVIVINPFYAVNNGFRTMNKRVITR